MICFSLFLHYKNDFITRIVAEGCSYDQVLSILSRHLKLSEVDSFLIVPFDSSIPFKEYTL